MDQQISPSASSQTASTALQTANSQDKSAGKGIFAKLLAIIEGKTNTDNGADSEESFKSSAKAAVASPVASIADKADANLLSVEKSAVKKAKSEQKESSDIIIADADIEIQNNSHPKPRLIAANKSVELNTSTVTDTEEIAATIKADVNQSAKTGARAEASPAVANHGARAEASPAVASHGADVKEVADTIKADVNQSAKAGARVEANPAVANHGADVKEVATAPGKVVNPDSKVRNEQHIIANEQRIAGNKAAMQQVASSTMQPEKNAFVQAEAGIVSILPEQHRLSTNNFVKGRKVNLDNISKIKAQPIQVSTDKKSELMTGHQRQQPMQSSEPFSTSMRDVMVQAETFSRSGRQSFDSANSQVFQVSGLDSTSTLMRSVYQPHQSMLSSGPWPVAAAMQQIGQAAGQGKFQMELTLTPEHLGKIQVFLDSDVNKQIQVHFVIEQSTSRQTIEQHLPALRQALADQGLNMDSFSMESSEQHKDNQQNRQNQNSLSNGMMAGSSKASENRVDPSSDSRLSIRV